MHILKIEGDILTLDDNSTLRLGLATDSAFSATDTLLFTLPQLDALSEWITRVKTQLDVMGTNTGNIRGIPGWLKSVNQSGLHLWLTEHFGIDISNGIIMGSRVYPWPVYRAVLCYWMEKDYTIPRKQIGQCFNRTASSVKWSVEAAGNVLNGKSQIDWAVSFYNKLKETITITESKA